MAAVICPCCNKPAQESQTKYGIRHDCCGLRSWGGKPLADGDTMMARKCAHASFDQLWKKGHMSRGAAYKALSKHLGVPTDEAHMSIMPADLARQVPGAVAKIWKGIKQ